MAADADDELANQEIVIEIDSPVQAVEVEPPPPAPDTKNGLAVEVEAAPAVEEARPDPTVDLQRQLEELSRRAESERNAREAEAKRRAEVEAYALRVTQDAERQEVELVDARLQAVTNAITVEEAEMERAEALLRHAIGKRDATLQTQAQKAIIQITQRMRDLKDGQEALASQKDRIGKKQPASSPAPSTQTSAQPPADAREQMLSRYTPQTQAYLRGRDPSWLTDPKTQNLLRSAHFAAAADGLMPDTPDYFAAIDKHMGYGQQQPQAAPPEPAPVQPAKKTTPAAPPTAKAASLPTGGKIVVKLTPGQLDAAKHLGLTPAEYARRIHMMSQPQWEGPRLGAGKEG